MIYFVKGRDTLIWLAYNIPFASNSTFLHNQNYDNRPKYKLRFYFMHNTIIGRGNVIHFHVAENKCLIFPRAV